MNVSCACARSLALICALGGSGALAGFLAQRGCVEGGGRVSEAAWVCEAAGSSASIWSLVTLDAAFLSVLLVGLPVYLAVSALGRRHGA